MTQPSQLRSITAPAPRVSRMTFENIETKVVRAPMRIVIWGQPGVGKTTFAAHAPRPIFIGAEDGAEQIGVARFPVLESFQDYADAISEILRRPKQFETLVVDSLAPLEALLHKHVCAENSWKDISAPAYGKGFAEAVSWWRLILNGLDQVRREKRMNVIVVGHSTTKPYKNPEGDDYDRFEMQLHAKAWELIKAWADAVLFARHEVLTSTKDKRTRGVSTGSRVLCTQARAAYDAKTRWLMPETIPLSWEEFSTYVDEGYSQAAVDRMLQQLKEAGDLLTGTEHEPKVAKAFEWAGSDPVKIAQSVERLRALADMAGKTAEETNAKETAQ